MSLYLFDIAARLYHLQYADQTSRPTLPSESRAPSYFLSFLSNQEKIKENPECKGLFRYQNAE